MYSPLRLNVTCWRPSRHRSCYASYSLPASPNFGSQFSTSNVAGRKRPLKNPETIHASKTAEEVQWYRQGSAQQTAARRPQPVRGLRSRTSSALVPRLNEHPIPGADRLLKKRENKKKKKISPTPGIFYPNLVNETKKIRAQNSGVAER